MNIMIMQQDELKYMQKEDAVEYLTCSEIRGTNEVATSLIY